MRFRIQFLLQTICLILAMCAAVSNAQEAEETSGSRLTGIVVDSVSGQLLVEATLVLTELGTVSRTDLDGRYLFRDVVPGSYTLRVFKAGYETFDISDVQIAEGQLNRLNVPVPRRAGAVPQDSYEEGEIIELEAFMVTADAIASVDTELLMVRQRAAFVGDAIGSDFMGKVGVSDAAMAMSKVVGASVEDGKYVIIRGLGDRYTNTTLNNISVPSADPDRRAVQLDQFPTDVLESIVTSKSFTPDQPGAFTGGSINLKTRSFPPDFFLNAGASVEYNTQTTGKDVLSVPGGSKDWQARDDGSRAMPEGLPVNLPIPTSNAERFAEFKAVQDLFDSRPSLPTERKADPNFGLNFSVGDQIWTGKESSFGYILSFNYDRSISHFDKGISARYSQGATNPDSPGFIGYSILYTPNIADLNYAFELEAYPENIPWGTPAFGVTRTQYDVNWGGMSQVAYRFNFRHEVALRFFYNQSANEDIRLGIGESTRSDAGRYYERYSIQYTERSLSSLQLEGKSLFDFGRTVTLDWRLASGKSTQDQPDYRGIYFAWSISEADVAPFNDTNTRLYRKLEDSNDEAALDLTIPFTWLGEKTLSVKTGGVWSEGEREYRGRSFEYRNQIQNRADYENFPLNTYQQADNFRQVRNYLRNAAIPSPDYEGEQGIYAGYAMIDAELTLKLRLITGVRAERTEIKTVPASANTGQIKETDYLPAISLVYALRDDMNLRAAYGKTIARPTYKELADIRTTDVFLDVNYIGNPNLQLTEIDNFDLRWEWYPGQGEIVAVTAFFKDMKNPIEQIFNPSSGAIRPDNAEDGEIYGLEFEYRQGLGRYLNSLEHFSLGFNLALIESKISITQDELDLIRKTFPDFEDKRDLVGQSPYTLNVDLSFEQPDWGTSATLVYNIVGDRLSKVNYGPLPDSYERARPTLDMILSQALNRNWSLKFKAGNLLNSYYEVGLNHQGRDYYEERYRSGRNFSLSLSYSFN